MPAGTQGPLRPAMGLQRPSAHRYSRVRPESHWGEMKGEADELMCGNVTKYESGHMWAHPRQCCSDVVSIHPCASIRTCLARVSRKAVSACLCLLYDSVWPTCSCVHVDGCVPLYLNLSLVCACLPPCVLLGGSLCLARYRWLIHVPLQLR